MFNSILNVMFSGIVKYVGIVTKSLDGDLEGVIGVSNKDISRIVEVGGSVAVNGVCLTVVEKTSEEVYFFASYETCQKTNIPKLRVGSIVNLELPSTPTTFLDGHIVLGHIDTMGEVYKIGKLKSSYKLSVSISKEFLKNVVFKGSVAIDGVSLTVYEIDDSLGIFSVVVIPYTYDNTNLRYLKIGDFVNIEFDIIGKYIERFSYFGDKRITIDKLRDFLGT
ncbi:MAG: riboflavin synthase [Brevinematia bacterium]